MKKHPTLLGATILKVSCTIAYLDVHFDNITKEGLRKPFREMEIADLKPEAYKVAQNAAVCILCDRRNFDSKAKDNRKIIKSRYTFGFFGKLNTYSGQLPSNNLLLYHICISSLISTVILVLGFAIWIGFYSIDEPKDNSFEGFMKRAYWIPFLILLSFLKIYSTAFPWYWMWFYPLIVIFPQNERRLLTKLLGVTFIIGIIDFVDMTVGLGSFI